MAPLGAPDFFVSFVTFSDRFPSFEERIGYILASIIIDQKLSDKSRTYHALPNMISIYKKINLPTNQPLIGFKRIFNLPTWPRKTL